MPTRPPPDPPPTVDQPLADYLRRLSLWAMQEIDKKIGKTEPTQQVLLTPITQKTPTVVWALVVNDAGAIAVQRVPFGSGKP